MPITVKSPSVYAGPRLDQQPGGGGGQGRSCDGHGQRRAGAMLRVRTPFGVRTPQLDSPFSLEQQLRAQYKFGKPVVLCWDPGGESSYIS